jgi:hypothetical protein
MEFVTDIEKITSIITVPIMYEYKIDSTIKVPITVLSADKCSVYNSQSPIHSLKGGDH